MKSKLFLFTLFSALLMAQSADNFIIDTHTHIGFEYIEDEQIEYSHLKYYNERGVSDIVFTFPIYREKFDNLLSQVQMEMSELEVYSRKYKLFDLAKNQKKIESLAGTGELGVIPGLEYFYNVFNNDVETVFEYRKLGIRIITIMDNEYDNLFEKNGLTKFGEKIIEKMNQQDILIDLSHLSKKYQLAVINHSSKPVVFSHSASYTIAPLNGNLTHEVVKKLKENNGSVFIKFTKNGLYGNSNKNRDPFDKFVDHVDYFKKELGIDHVGIGSDLQENGKYVPEPMRNKSVFQKIKKKLTERGYTKEEIEKVMGLNFFRLLN